MPEQEQSAGRNITSSANAARGELRRGGRQSDFASMAATFRMVNLFCFVPRSPVQRALLYYSPPTRKINMRPVSLYLSILMKPQ